MKRLSLIFIGVLLLLGSLGFRGCGKDSVTVRIKPVENQVWEIKLKSASPRGVQVWAQDGTTITAEDLDAIERGFEKTFIKSRCRGYKSQLHHSDYIVAILKAADTDSDGNPAYRLPAGPYAGTIYDKGGYILVAGQMVFVGQPYGNVIAIPDHSFNFDHMARVAEYEAEHVILAWNDPDEFERTKIHIGNSHPIIPNCPDTPVAEKSKMIFGDPLQPSVITTGSPE